MRTVITNYNRIYGTNNQFLLVEQEGFELFVFRFITILKPNCEEEFGRDATQLGVTAFVTCQEWLQFVFFSFFLGQNIEE